MENDYQIDGMQNFRFQELMSNFVAKSYMILPPSN